MPSNTPLNKQRRPPSYDRRLVKRRGERILDAFRVRAESVGVRVLRSALLRTRMKRPYRVEAGRGMVERLSVGRTNRIFVLDRVRTVAPKRQQKVRARKHEVSFRLIDPDHQESGWERVEEGLRYELRENSRYKRESSRQQRFRPLGKAVSHALIQEQTFGDVAWVDAGRLAWGRRSMSLLRVYGDQVYGPGEKDRCQELRCRAYGLWDTHGGWNGHYSNCPAYEKMRW
jgi:hypothetical protein